MALNFKKTAQDAGVTKSGLLEKKQGTRLDQILGEYVTITAVEPDVGVLEGARSRYPALLIKEYPDRYFRAGAGKIAQLIAAWADEVGCPRDPDANDMGWSCVHKNYDELNAELDRQGGVKLVFKYTNNPKTGRDYLDFDFVD